jgi:hypothetical protein
MTNYTKPSVQLSGTDGNAFAIMGEVSRALRKSGCRHDVIEKFREEAMASDYDNLLRVCMKWVDVS